MIIYPPPLNRGGKINRLRMRISAPPDKGERAIYGEGVINFFLFASVCYII